MNKKLFFLLILIALFIGIASQELLDTEELIYSTLEQQFSSAEIEGINKTREKWEWIGYLFVVFLLIIKITLISTVLYVGSYFFNKDIAYKKLFNTVTKAEFLLVAVGVIKLFWFLFQDSYSLEDIQYFHPLSALNIIGYEDIKPWFVYPLQVLNLFELTYWFVLAYLLGKELNVSMDKGFKIVASSYGPALLIWVVGVMFFTLNMS